MMIMRKRAELDTVNPPGQVVNRGERTTAVVVAAKEQTLQHYLDRKYPEKKKLTFDEWWNSYKPTMQYDDFQVCWDTAQENT